MQDRYEKVYRYFLDKEWIDLRLQALVVDLCAGDGWISKYCDRYYWCDIEPRDEINEWWHRRVQTATDKAFVKYIKPKMREETLGDRILCSFWYWGKAWLGNLKDKDILESELLVESQTLDDSIFDLLEVSDWFVLEGCSTYVDWFIEKYRFDDEDAVYYEHREGSQWNLDRKLYIFKIG